MGSGRYDRPACPGCGKKTMDAMQSVSVSEFYDVPARRCRSCRCAFWRDLLVSGPSRVVTQEIQTNRATALTSEASAKEHNARCALETAADMREVVRGMLEIAKRLPKGK